MSELKKLNLSPSPNLAAQPSTDPTLKKTSTSKSAKPIIAITVVILSILAGVGTGYGVYRVLPASLTGLSSSDTTSTGATVKVGDVIGVQDEQTFKDNAEGVLEKGGIDGEGSHSLLREGGPSQTVYLTSSIIDLDELVGHKVKLWGETFSAQKAGWLMDVGRIKVLEINAQKPF